MWKDSNPNPIKFNSRPQSRPEYFKQIQTFASAEIRYTDRRGRSRVTIPILIMKDNEMHYFSDLFDKELYMFRTSPLSIIRNISTLYTRNRYCHASSVSIRSTLADANRTSMTNTYCVYTVLSRGEFRPRQTRQLPRAVDLKGRLPSCQSY